MKFSEEDIDALINNKPFTLGSCRTQQEEETMNDNLNTSTFKPVPTAPTPADMVEAHKVMDDFDKLSDEQFEKLLEGKPLDGTAAYLTDADETADEATPTVH